MLSKLLVYLGGQVQDFFFAEFRDFLDCLTFLIVTVRLPGNQRRLQEIFFKMSVLKQFC